ncbi:MAG: hypothetical protein ACYC64_13635 [Armatimonadota bacterium]
MLALLAGIGGFAWRRKR